jgi:hypothetical protein
MSTVKPIPDGSSVVMPMLVWLIATRVEDTSEDQRQERWSSIASAKS